MNTRSVTTRGPNGTWNITVYNADTDQKISAMRGDNSGNRHEDSFDAKGNVWATSDHVVTRDAQNRMTSNTSYTNGQQTDRQVYEYH